MKALFFTLLGIFSGISILAQDFALKQLESSSRHQEWIKIDNAGRKVNCFVVYPEVSTKATVVIIIHENRGLTDWVRSFADQLAAAGYIAVAPDMLSDFAPNISKTSEFPSSDEARNAIYQLEQSRVTTDLNAVQAYAEKISAGNGKTVVVGFCWGGSQSFQFATNNRNIKAALVFYGGSPESKEDIGKITAPVYAFYAGNDERINAGIESTKMIMQKADKTYDYIIYEGGEHGFMRQGDDPAGRAEDKKARDEAWKRMLEILKEI